MSYLAPEPRSRGTPEDTGYDSQGQEGVFGSSRSGVAFACELSSISVKKSKATILCAEEEFVLSGLDGLDGLYFQDALVALFSKRRLACLFFARSNISTKMSVLSRNT